MSGLVQRLDERSGAHVRLVLDRPKGNVLTIELMDALGDELARIAAPRPANHVKLVTIEGAGADFSFGASVEEHAPGLIAQALPRMHRVIQDLLAVPAPTGAIVTGRCLGGGFELALACDFIWASEDARFGLPEVALGVFPPAGSVLLPFRVGTARATRAIVTGAARTAADWAASGLIELVAPADELRAAVGRWFDCHLASRSASALRHAAAAARLALRAHVAQVLPDVERLYLNRLMSTHDAVEGIDAFIARRTPVWRDA